MLNILPKEQKNVLKKEYQLRRIVVWLGLVFVSLAVSLVLILPSYLVYRIKARDVRTELERSRKLLEADFQSGDVAGETTRAIKNTEELKPFTAKTSVYSLLKIFESKPNTVRISEISFLSQGVEASKLLVRGIAADRESLTSFARALESRPEFGSIDLPVSNFAKERSIDFSMTITIK